MFAFHAVGGSDSEPDRDSVTRQALVCADHSGVVQQRAQTGGR